ncbi:hypothetical protein PUMCH_001572 [Australozyma saopauloensis]|uniref:RING-type domain-containing protein n=1 Tax=Australozyma saopauloensis TaxID=291208 RepID=A0AAX4H758_9ASCO|nr:hypothetical protein PUMCH_001572 [[Candida] saopauloensis]
MECPICLDPLALHSVVGRVHHCNHVYHEKCIVAWSGRSNLCPTCRKLFNGIDIFAQNLPHVIISTVAVQNRLNENDAIDNIPLEYIITPVAYQEQMRQLSEREHERLENSSSGVCLICSSAQYSRVLMKMAVCIGCDANFHHNCLGRTDESNWFCPVCDCYQEFPFCARDGSGSIHESVVPPRPSQSSISFLDNLDDFEELAPLVRGSNVINGGVLLRREERARRNLTPDEAKSWDLFEQARTGGKTELLSQSLNTEQFPRRKRRPKITSLSPNSNVKVPILVGPKGSTSRITSLMSQIKSKANGVGANTPDSPIIVVDLGDQRAKHPTLDPTTGLSLGQKRRVQKHVRKALLRYYNGEESKNHWIKTELQYIEINKVISRGVYQEIMAQFNSDELLQNFFSHHDQQLEGMVLERVGKWEQSKMNE